MELYVFILCSFGIKVRIWTYMDTQSASTKIKATRICSLTASFRSVGTSRTIE
jgi:hypothetical protein